MKKSVFNELTFHDFEKSVHNVQNEPIIKEQMSFRSYNHKIYTVKSNKLYDNFQKKNFKITIG